MDQVKGLSGNKKIIFPDSPKPLEKTFIFFMEKDR